MNTAKMSKRPYRLVGGLSSMLLIFTACGGGSSPSGSGGKGGAGTGGTASGGEGGHGGHAGLCGNGVVDPQETCDTAIPASEPGACATSCDDGAVCTKDQLSGAGTCATTCEHTVITACASGDGCCPSGCTFDTDSDCSKTCGDGTLDANEQCDTGIAPGQPGSCPTSCNDGLSCTTETLLNAGTCAAECAHAAVTACVDGDGCCPSGCPSDSDCTPLSRIKQTVITDSGQANWYRNGYWNGMTYTGWTALSGQGMTQLLPQMGSNQLYRGIDHVVLGDGRLKQTVLQMDGTRAWYRYGTWDGSTYSNWTSWSSQFGDLSQIVPVLGAGQAYRSYDHVVFPDGQLKQTLLTFDGKTIWQRYATWNGTAYASWTDWTNTWGDLTHLIPGQGTSQSFRSFNHVLLADKRMKQAVLSEDGHTVYHRYGTWNGTAFSTWTSWTSQYGDLTQLLPGQGSNQAYLAFDEGALSGTGAATGCQNGCDDGDPCTVDACVANVCQHAAMVCDDGDGCTTDSCVNGACQHAACSGQCQNGTCQPTTTCQCNGCQDTCGQPCNEGGSCGSNATCQNGSCQPVTTCQCNDSCKDTCNQPCNQGAVCAPNAVCQNGSCNCTTQFCGGVCCAAGDACSGGKCCPTPQSGFCNGKCGNVMGPCGAVNCGGCNAATVCCPNNVCDDVCQ